MKAWTLMLLLVLAGCGQPTGRAKAPVASKAQAQAAAGPGEQLAQEAGASLIGKYAPPLVLTTVDGGRIDLGKLYGKTPVYLKFWATWCVPCRLQMPHFENVERTQGGRMQVVAVDVDFNETKDAVLRYRQQMGLTMPIVIDDGRLADALHLRVTPQHIVIGRDGRILFVGQQVTAKLNHALEQAIAEPVARYPDAGAPAGARRAAQPPPAIRTLSGEPLALGDGARPTVIYFFSPWCEGYFKTSRPAMSKACLQAREQVSSLARSSGVRWLGVAAGLWATRKDVVDYQRQNPLPMPMALDDTGAFFRAFKVADVPSFVVLDSSGHVVLRTRLAKEAARTAAQMRRGARSKEVL